MHDRPADEWPMKSAKHTSPSPILIGGHAPPRLDPGREYHQHAYMSPDSSYPPLRFLSEWSEIRVSKNRLPHWEVARVACFVTFRLADSLPEDLLSEWRKERAAWLLEHPKPWAPATESEYHKRFSARIDQALDAGQGPACLA